MSDFENEFTLGEDFVGQEKLNYQRYYIASNTRRPTQAPTFMTSLKTMALPNQSVLHSLNGFDTLVSPSEGMPDPLLPLVLNEKFPIYLKIQTQLATELSKPYGILDNYIYRPNTLMPSIMHFFQHNRKYHRILSDRTLATMSGVLTWVDYSPTNEVRVNGTLNTYRKWDILFRTILDTVLKIGPSKHHYILLPQGNQVFGRSILQRGFRELSTGTLNPLSHDPSAFTVLHLLGYVYGKTNTIPVTPYKADIKLLGKDSPILTNLRSTSLLERIPEEMHESINFILYREDKAIVYNLKDITSFADDISFYTKFYRHLMNLRIDQMMLPAHIEADSDQFDTLVSSMSGTTVVEEEHPEVTTTAGITTDPNSKQKDQPKPETKTLLTTTPQKPIIQKVLIPENKQEDLRLEKEEKSFEDQIRATPIDPTSPSLPPEQKLVNKKAVLVEKHLNATIGGSTIGELIQPTSREVIIPKQMDFVKSAPEESYKSSSLSTMDKTYQETTYKKELGKVLGSLGKHGLYITKIDEEKVNLEMDRTTTYKVALQDVNGKAHNVRFTLPDIDENGNMKLGGIEYRLTRQMVNLPICKISPTEVSLSSHYNKIIVEKIVSKRNNFENDIKKLIYSLNSEGRLKAISGSAPAPTKHIAYDYTAIGRSFTEISFEGYYFFFGGDSAPLGTLNFDGQDKLDSYSQKYGIYVGYKEDNLLFWDRANQIHEIDRKGELLSSWKSFNHLLADQLGADAIPPKTITQWTQASILNQRIPLIFILSYRFGLKAVLDMIRLDYRFYPQGTKAEVDIMDIAIKFSDGTLVFNRYPLTKSLIASGLSWVKLNDISFKDLSLSDTYGKVFAKKNMSVGVLKGLSGFFDFFVDPITESILEKMNEPTTFHELLLRANVMLSDYKAEESSSLKLHRFRLYERFNGIVYNEIFRALANHRNNPTTKKAFSINPEAVFQRIVQDATISPNDTINPVHEVKQRANFTFTGAGGRNADSFVLKDRIYPQDGLGVISENVPDSSKVGITSYLSSSPNIDDIHGIPNTSDDIQSLEGPQLLSIANMLMPLGTTDDGKRSNYSSIQMSHYVPNIEDGETLSVRTGYDEVLPHLTTSTFAIAAEDDGIIESIDEKHQVITVRYKDKVIPTLKTIKVPYLDNALVSFKNSNKAFGLLIPESELINYPIGGIFSVSKTVNAKVTDRLRCETIDSIPDKEVARKQNNLIQDFIRGKHKALYYVRFTPLGIKAPGVIKSFSYKDVYSPVSGSYVQQQRKPNVKQGEVVKQGDVLVYNPGFFVPDPMSKQVTFKHGVIATVALVEKASNLEDASEISKDLANKLKMTPCHQRQVITKKDAVVLDIVKQGQHVETTDDLCVISDDYLVGTSNSLSIDNLDIMSKLSRQTPPADYTGTISKIRILYSCEREELSESLKSILKVYEKEVLDNFKALNPNRNRKPPERPGWVAKGTRYAGVDFQDDTVILEFMINEEMSMSEGDKLCLNLQLKSIISNVNEKSHYTESGTPVDMLFSTTGVLARIVNSAFLVGIAERNLEKLKENVLAMYFKK